MIQKIETILKKYVHDEEELFLKAKFTLVTTVFLILALIAAMVSSYLSEGMNPILLSEAIGLILLPFSLTAILKGL